MWYFVSFCAGGYLMFMTLSLLSISKKTDNAVNEWYRERASFAIGKVKSLIRSSKSGGIAYEDYVKQIEREFETAGV